LWIEPKGDWGKGAVTLYEIPTESEINDNIVAMWKPQRTLKAGQSYSFSYRMYWGVGALNLPPRAKVEKFMIGAAGESRKRFVIDFVGRPLRDIEMPKVRASVSRGVLSNVVVQRNSVTNGWRVTYLLNPKSAESIDIRLSLTSGEKDISEVFLYRWTKDK
jgi:glucans biosynthesis protein